MRELLEFIAEDLQVLREIEHGFRVTAQDGIANRLNVPLSRIESYLYRLKDYVK